MVIDARLALGFQEDRLKTRHLRIHKPEKTRHAYRSVFELWITLRGRNQWVLNLATRAKIFTG
jgi:mannose-6-phosphate isomerase-like protein (cupin superfamily)